MPYKTIILGLIEQQPELHQRLRRSRTMLRAMDEFAVELKANHDALKEQLSRSRPHSDPTQIASESLEIAVKAMEEQLASASGRSEHETFSLDEAMNHTRRHTANA